MMKSKLPRLIGTQAAIAIGAISMSANADVIQLKWDASPDSSVTRYRVYSSPSATDPFTPIQDTQILEANVTSEGSSVGYRFYVTALNAEGAESDPSNAIQLGPQLAYNRPSEKNLLFSWDEVGFALESAPSVEGPWTVRSTTSPITISSEGPPQFFRLMKN